MSVMATRRIWLLLLLAPAARSAADEPLGGTISTLAGTGLPQLGLFTGDALDVNLNQPFGVEVAPDGLLYICEVGNHRVLRLDLKKVHLDTVAGDGNRGYSGDGAAAAAARLDEPYELRLDRGGDIYFVEMAGAVVRKVDRRTGVISTVAGTGKSGFKGDGGPAREAELSSPHSIALDGEGGLYVADIGNHRIRRVDLKTGKINTIAGTGEAKLPREGALADGEPLRGPRALCVAHGFLYIALREGHSVWKMDLQGRRLGLVAGTGEKGYLDGPARKAAFNGPKGIAAGPRNDLYVADTENHAIRRIDLEKRTVETVAGSGPAARGFAGDGGPALKAMLDRPHGIAVDASGTLYIGDSSNHRVRRVEKAGPMKVWNFDGDRTAGPPLGFNVEMGEWQVAVDPAAPSGKNVLAQTAKSSRTVFNLALVKEPSFGDVDVSVKLRPVAGEVDQGGGVVWRARDRRNYYVARYNPLEGNFRVYKLEDGKRIQLGTAEVEAAEGWRTLRATMKGDHIECYLDGKKHLDVKDGLFREPGLIGLWTKADAQTHFDDLAALLPLAPPPVGEAGKGKEKE